ncbi:hypothetical protein BJV78DRAFT_1153033 [Lactifluus subvellereus]|nr:hypothetical protein BJV78DRAFT_1153033 [Lactifluus subvellereus]
MPEKFDNPLTGRFYRVLQISTSAQVRYQYTVRQAPPTPGMPKSNVQEQWIRKAVDSRRCGTSSVGAALCATATSSMIAPMGTGEWLPLLRAFLHGGKDSGYLWPRVNLVCSLLKKSAPQAANKSVDKAPFHTLGPAKRAPPLQPVPLVGSRCATPRLPLMPTSPCQPGARLRRMLPGPVRPAARGSFVPVVEVEEYTDGAVHLISIQLFQPVDIQLGALNRERAMLQARARVEGHTSTEPHRDAVTSHDHPDRRDDALSRVHMVCRVHCAPILSNGKHDGRAVRAWEYFARTAVDAKECTCILQASICAAMPDIQLLATLTIENTSMAFPETVAEEGGRRSNGWPGCVQCRYAGGGATLDG